MAERYALVIDDDTTFRDRIYELLAPHAIEVSSTADEAEALSLLENLHPRRRTDRSGVVERPSGSSA